MFHRKSLKKRIAITGFFIVLLECVLVFIYLKNHRPFLNWESGLFFLVGLVSCFFIFLLYRQFSIKAEAMNTIFEALNAGVMVVDEGSVISYINAKGAKLLGMGVKELLGYAFLEVKPTRYPALWHHCQRVVKNALNHQAEYKETVTLNDYSPSHIDMIITPINDTGGRALILQDSSSQYRIRERGKDFIANAAHELRTPITIIKGFAETLKDLPQVSDAMLEDIIEKILRSCHRMDSLVKNLLTLVSLDTLPKARLQECDLVALVDHCNNTLLTVHPHVTIESFRNKDRIITLGDSDLLELAIMNILENAVKYSSKVPHITVTIEERESDTRLSIQDRGIGIAKEELPQIFERFYTVNRAYSRSLGGAGLGLSIVDRIIKEHDGRITATSKPKEGTIFTCEFIKNQYHIPS